MAERGVLRLTLLDLVLVAGIAVASFWMGQGIATELADSIIGEPVPDVAFQIQYGVPSDKDSISSLEDQQKIVSYQVALTQTLLETERIELGHATGASAASLSTQVSESSALLDELKVRQKGLSKSLDDENRALANDEYHAQKSATRSSSLRRLGVWGIQAMGSLGMFLALVLVLSLLRLGIRNGLHVGAVIVGALVALVILLVTAYAGWVGLMLSAIVVLSLLAIGGRGGNVRAR